MDQVRERIRGMHDSQRSEDAHVHWIKAFIRFHALRHPSQMGGPRVSALLNHLASKRCLSMRGERLEPSAPHSATKLPSM